MSVKEPLISTAYLQIRKGQFHGEWSVSTRVIKSTQNKPEVIEPGCIVVKVQLRIPREAWDPFEPTAVIDVPPELIQYPIEVEAVDGA